MTTTISSLSDIINVDQHIRHFEVAKIIKVLKKDTGTILDVGGEDGKLSDYLPNTKVSILDPLIKHSTESSISGSILDSNLNIGPYDIVCGLDMLEHIPAKKRTNAIENMLCLAKDFVILTFPFLSEENVYTEKLVYDLFKEKLNKEDTWLNEHQEYGLPELDKIEKFLKKQNLNFAILPNQNRESWIAIMFNYVNAIAHQDDQDQYLNLLRKYWDNIYQDESVDINSAYRAILIISKKATIANIPSSFNTAGFSSVNDFVLETLLNEHRIKDYLKISLNENSEKYHQLGSDFDLLHKKNLANEKTILELREESLKANDSILKFRKDLFESNNIIAKLNKEIVAVNNEKELYKRNHHEAMFQRNDFERQLQEIYRSPKWKIANLIVLPFKPLVQIPRRILPYAQEIKHSLKDVQGYRNTFGNKFALIKLNQLIGLYTKSLRKQCSREKGQRIGVLFLSDEQSNCYRYRVLNQMEQLDNEKIYSKDVSVNFPRLDSLIGVFDIFIFARPHDTAKNLQLAELIKKMGKVVIFENDDLIFSPSAVKESGLLKILPKNLRDIYVEGIGTRFIKLADYGLTTTKTIQQEMEKLKVKTFINRNALNSEIVEISKKVVKDSQDGNYVNIGYFSGSKTHNGDFQKAKQPILEILKKYENIRLIVVGYIELGKEFEIYKDRIINLPYVNWRNLPKNIKLADINIVPLDLNLFNQAKSELKYFEAGILKVPTVASATKPYQHAIQDGINGFLADTEKEWFEKLERLIKDEKLRKKIGEEAYNHTLQNYTAKSRTVDFTKFIIDIAKRNKKK